MSQPYRSYRPGERVFVRAEVLEHCNSLLRSSVAVLRIADYPSLIVTTFAPLSEIARPEDVQRLLASMQAAEPF